jgi:hypothetical protein
LLKFLDAITRHGNPFGAQQGALELEISAEPSQPAAGGDHTMTRHIGRFAVAHDVTDGAERASVPGCGGHVAVGRHPARWNAPDD